MLERQIQRQAELRQLRRMHVEVDQSRQQDLIRTERNQAAGRGEPRGRRPGVGRPLGMNGLYAAVGAGHDQRVAKVLQTAAHRRVQRVAEECALSGWFGQALHGISDPAETAAPATAAHSDAGLRVA